MDIQAAKIAFMEEFLKLKDESIIKKLVTTLKREKQKSKEKSIEKVKPSVDKFVGIWSKEEAEEIKKVIAEGCEQINEEDW